MSDSFFVYTKRNPFWLRQQRAIAEREPNLTYHGPQYRYHYYHYKRGPKPPPRLPDLRAALDRRWAGARRWAGRARERTQVARVARNPMLRRWVHRARMTVLDRAFQAYVP